ncbi:hypothetical protein BDW22DRAFT_1324602 [Trametopsis cervina]|nr:hypothetical protein BDW22DRAFT_1324602 [Trametopsis cervina]
MSVRPFSPTERWSFPKPPTVQGSPRSSARQSYVDDLPSAATANTFIPPRTSSTSPASYNTASFHSANDDDNPFADFADAEDDMQTTETFVTATTTATELYRIERVSRQFTPTRPDEIAVAPGDEVRVLKHFDDGWAYAEHVSTSRKGLFPIDCLRMPDEDLPAFLSKRLSGYSGWVRPPSAVVMHH